MSAPTIKITPYEKKKYGDLIEEIIKLLSYNLNNRELSQGELKLLASYARELWEYGIKYMLNTAWETSTDELREKLQEQKSAHMSSGNLEKLKASQAMLDEIDNVSKVFFSDVFKVITFDNLSAMSMEEFDRAILAIIIAYKGRIDKEKQNMRAGTGGHIAEVRIQLYSKFIVALESGVNELEPFNVKAYKDKNSLLSNSVTKTIFPAVGAFIGIVSAVIATPILYTGIVIAATGMNFVDGEWTLDSNSLILKGIWGTGGVVLGVGVGLVVGPIVSLMTMFGMADIHSPIVTGAKIGRELGIRASDPAHQFRTSALEAAYKLRENMRPLNRDTRANFVKNIDASLNGLFRYFELNRRFQQGASLEEEELYDDGKHIAPMLLTSVTSSLNIELERLQKAVQAAVGGADKDAIRELAHRITLLENDWGRIQTALDEISYVSSDANIQKFYDVSLQCLERIQAEYPVKAQKTGYDFSHEKKTQIWSKYVEPNNFFKEKLDDTVKQLQTLSNKKAL